MRTINYCLKVISVLANVSGVFIKSTLMIFLSLNCLICLSQREKLNFEVPVTYQTEYNEVPSDYSFLKDTVGFVNSVKFEQDAEIEQLWWQTLNDNLLDSLIDVAIKDNYNLLIAQQRIIQSREAMQSAMAGFFPSFDLSGGWQRAGSSLNTSNSAYASLMPRYTSYFNAAVSSSWEIDVFGSIRKKYMQERNLYKASKMDYNSTMISMAASVATAYINILTSQRLLNVLRSNISSQKEIVDITQARFEAGLSSQLDVAQAKSTYYNTRASITSYETSFASYINSLAVLLGTLPSSVTPIFEKLLPMPSAESIVPVSIPAALLRQRPDILEAEYQLKAQADALGVAQKEWLPTFMFSGSIGFSGHDLNKWFKEKSMVWQVAPVVKWTIFNGGARAAAVRSAQSQLQQYVDNYNLVVLTSLQEVDNAIIAYKNSVRQNLEYKTAAVEALSSLTLSIELYKMGLSAFINVQTSLQTLLSYELSLAQSEGSALIDLIKLYQALGGGWQIQ